MLVTILAAILLMAAYFLVLYGGVGFIRDKRFFSSAPKENLDAIPDKKERFRGAHIIGWIIEGIAVLLFLVAAVLAAWDGIRNGFGFFRFFGRYLIMLYCMELYDILFFDWFLLCHSNFGYLEKMVVFDLSSRFKSKSALFLLVVFCSITGILY